MNIGTLHDLVDRGNRVLEELAQAYQARTKEKAVEPILYWNGKMQFAIFLMVLYAFVITLSIKFHYPRYEIVIGTFSLFVFLNIWVVIELCIMRSNFKFLKVLNFLEELEDPYWPHHKLSETMYHSNFGLQKLRELVLKELDSYRKEIRRLERRIKSSDNMNNSIRVKKKLEQEYCAKFELLKTVFDLPNEIEETVTLK